MDLDEPAAVHWPEGPPTDIVRGHHSKSCETVAEAVRFVIEDLPEPFRSLSHIAAPAKHLDYDEILAIYESSEYKGAQRPKRDSSVRCAAP